MESITVRQALSGAVKKLLSAGVPDAELDAEWLLAHVLKKTRLEMKLSSFETLSEEQEQAFAALLLCRIQREPLQYILRTQDFYGLELVVDENVLIPRPETETLCEEAIRLIQERVTPSCRKQHSETCANPEKAANAGTQPYRVLDLCTGSGAIALAIKHECPMAEVTACDLSRDALKVACQNADALKLPIRFLQGDLFAPVKGEQFDMILSNPPYIPTEACSHLQEEVQKEPLMALDGGEDGLDFYRRIAEEAPAHLRKNGWILVECGNTQTEAVAELFCQYGFTKVEAMKDLYGLPRIVKACFIR